MSWLLLNLAGYAMPERFRRAIDIGALVLALLLALWGIKTLYDRELIARHEAKATAQVGLQVAKGTASAAAAVHTHQTEVEQSNAHARAAADGSDDPLRAGLDQLHADKAAPRPAAQ